jgi:hypothetical protein
MKNNQTALVLVGLLFLMSLGTALLLYRYNSSARELQDLSLKIQLANNTQSFMQQLLNQVVEYSKRDPAVLPLLQWATNNTASVPAPIPAKSPKQ